MFLPRLTAFLLKQKGSWGCHGRRPGVLRIRHPSFRIQSSRFKVQSVTPRWLSSLRSMGRSHRWHRLCSLRSLFCHTEITEITQIFVRFAHVFQVTRKPRKSQKGLNLAAKEALNQLCEIEIHGQGIALVLFAERFKSVAFVKWHCRLQCIHCHETASCAVVCDESLFHKI